MIIQIEHMVPVMVFVDTKAKTVERVVVLDEDIRLPVLKNGMALPDKMWTENGTEITAKRVRRKALEALQDGGMWPHWEFGY